MWGLIPAAFNKIGSGISETDATQAEYLKKRSKAERDPRLQYGETPINTPNDPITPSDVVRPIDNLITMGMNEQTMVPLFKGALQGEQKLYSPTTMEMYGATAKPQGLPQNNNNTEMANGIYARLFRMYGGR